MPIPFLFIAAAAGTGLLGIGKGVKAGIDMKEANDTNNAAEYIVEKAKKRIESARKTCGEGIDSLGRRKVTVLDGSMQKFIAEFEKLNHVELSESAGLNELQKMVMDQKSFADLKDLQGMASSMAGGLASGAVLGAITAFGAYSAAGVLATASTGTAIATLSGAAATNATLAFFGGGSLAAGGLGMAGGAAVLGGLVAGPALAVLGFVVGAKASQNLDNAYSNYAKARKFNEEMLAAADLCSAIRRRAAMFDRFLIRLETVFDPLVYKMAQIIENRGCDYRTYTEDEKRDIASAMAIAGAIKAVLDTPILDKDGNLSTESEFAIDSISNKIKDVVL